MKVGVFLVALAGLPLEEALGRARESGCGAVELGCGGYPGDDHCRPAALLPDARALERFRRTIEGSGMEVSALSCHGNPLHPDRRVARAADENFRATVRLAAELGVKTVVTFSGCPGESEGSARPGWVTVPWPPEYAEALRWQWEARVAPYWTEAAPFARRHGVGVAIEPHPGFVVYNTDTLLRLREIGGETIGANFDPSHLFWQQMDPLACVAELGEAILHVHAKDTRFHARNLARKGVLDTADRADAAVRSWSFATVGRGHGPEFWLELVRALRRVGYDGALSIEHEDALVGPLEGITEAASVLGEAISGSEAS